MMCEDFEVFYEFLVDNGYDIFEIMLMIVVGGICML